MVFQFFGDPRPSKKASEDPRRLARGYLGLLGAIWSHLGAILETGAFKIALAGWDCALLNVIFSNLGVYFGAHTFRFFF